MAENAPDTDDVRSRIANLRSELESILADLATALTKLQTKIGQLEGILIETRRREQRLIDELAIAESQL
jgi:hypothetical protein